MSPLIEGLLRMPVAWSAALGLAGVSLGAALVSDPESAWVRYRPMWGRMVLKLTGVELNTVGGEHLTGPAIFASNHPGYMDAVLPTALMPPTTKWLMKREFERFPVLGRACRGGAFFIDRGDSDRARRAIAEGIAAMPEGWSLLVYPEGTRQGDGNLGPFKKGVFHLALATRLPIVPVASFGSGEVVPPGGLVVRPGRIEVTAGQAIDTKTWQPDEVDARIAEIRDAVGACAAASRRRWEGARHTL